MSASIPDLLLISAMVALPSMSLPTGELSILNFSFTFTISSFSHGYWTMSSDNLVSAVIVLIIFNFQLLHYPYIRVFFSEFFFQNLGDFLTCVAFFLHLFDGLVGLKQRGRSDLRAEVADALVPS